MDNLKICFTCGTQYPDCDKDEICKICDEERQYVPLSGQIWTSQAEMALVHENSIVKLKENLYEILITPSFGIGQRAFLIVSPNGNVLWDCVPFLDAKTVDFINLLGGLSAIAFSHPHYYSNMNTWSTVFDCPVYIHKEDAPYVYFSSEKIKYWEGEECLLWDSIKLVNIGGHYKGSSVIMIPGLSERGVMLTGDTLYLSLNKRHYSIMYSYPNRIPLPISQVGVIREKFRRLDFDEIYGFYSYQNVTENAGELLDSSLGRYY
jgi:hypothetical protein